MSLAQWSPERTQTHWDSRAGLFRSFYAAPSTQYYRRSEIRLIAEHLPLGGKRFLKTDLWNEARNTEILFWVAEQGAEVSGFDISAELVREVRDLFRQRRVPANIFRSDIRAIDLPDESFDALYSMGTVEHIPEYQRAFEEFHRVLRPGGKAIIGVPNLLDPFLRPALVTFLTAFGRYPYAPEKAFTHRQLRRCLERAGFECLKPVGLLFMPGVLRMLDVWTWLRAPALSWVTGAALRPFELAEEALPAVRRHGYMIAWVARRSPRSATNGVE